MSERDELIECLRVCGACHGCGIGADGDTCTNCGDERQLNRLAASLLERDGAELERLRERIAELERGEILTDKELMSAIITAVMSGVQSDRNDALRKVQRHIIRVEQERDEREAECEHTSEHRALAERRIVELEAEVERLRAGGCARDQRTTQYCAEAVRLGAENRLLLEAIDRLQQTWAENAPAVAYKARAEAAEKAIERVLPAKAREHIDCWKVNYGLDRYDKVTAARRWAEAGGPSDGPIMALATAIEWLEST